MKSEQNPTLSVVTSLYHSAPYIREFHTRIRASADALGVSREMIFVNDGETDNSIDVVRELIEEDGDVILVELSRNFGHHKALMTGIAHARGDFVFLIDADLEEDPAWLSTFWEILQAEPDLDVVYGIQRDRKGGLLERWCGWCFYKLFNRMSSIRVPENLVTARLMRSCYCRELLRFRERELFLGGILAATGFHQRAVPVRKDVSGKTTYTFFRRLSLFIDAFASFTSAPLVLLFAGGSLATLFAVGTGIYFILKKLLFGIRVEGWAMLMVSLWFLSGIVICSLSIVGLYVSKIFNEVKNRPYTIVRRIHGRDSAEA